MQKIKAVRMKMLFLSIILMLFTGSVFAGYTKNRIGNMDFYSGNDGYNGTGQQIGNMYFYSDNRGNNSTCTQIGDLTFCN